MKRMFGVVLLACLLLALLLPAWALADGGVTIAVQYQDSKGTLLGRDYVSLEVGRNEYEAVDAFMPAGYRLVGERKAVIMLYSNGKTDPETLVFTYAASGESVKGPVDEVVSGQQEGSLAPVIQPEIQPVAQPEIQVNPSKWYPEGSIANLQVGQTVEFGRYHQDQQGNITPIEWRVLQVEGNLAMLVSVKSLEARPFHNAYGSVSWETSEVRQWLNSNFFQRAFNAEEVPFVQLSFVKNDPNPVTGTYSGSDTKDHVFLLSIDEAERLFTNDNDRKAANTSHANYQGGRQSTGYGKWWLRTSGGTDINAAMVNGHGEIGYKGYFERDKDKVVRPAIWVDMAAFVK